MLVAASEPLSPAGGPPTPGPPAHAARGALVADNDQEPMPLAHFRDAYADEMEAALSMIQ